MKKKDKDFTRSYFAKLFYGRPYAWKAFDDAITKEVKRLYKQLPNGQWIRKTEEEE